MDDMTDAARLLATPPRESNMHRPHRHIWTPYWHERFLAAVSVCGHKWGAVAEQLDHHFTPKTIRNHAYRHGSCATTTKLVRGHKKKRKKQHARRPPVRLAVELVLAPGTTPIATDVRWCLAGGVLALSHTVQVVHFKTEAGERVVLAHAKHILVPWVDLESNVSRTIDRFASPEEKQKVRITGAHNHKIGQCCNGLTVAGVRRVCHQMAARFHKRNPQQGAAFCAWLLDTLVPHMQALSSF
jgi:hypothetical protein